MVERSGGGPCECGRGPGEECLGLTSAELDIILHYWSAVGCGSRENVLQRLREIDASKRDVLLFDALIFYFQQHYANVSPKQILDLIRSACLDGDACPFPELLGDGRDSEYVKWESLGYLEQLRCFLGLPEDTRRRLLQPVIERNRHIILRQTIDYGSLFLFIYHFIQNPQMPSLSILGIMATYLSVASCLKYRLKKGDS